MKEKLIEVENLTYFYPGSESPAISGVRFQIEPGEFILLLGSSGSGKSTLLRSLNGLIPHFYGGKISGSIRVMGIETKTSSVRELARYVGMVFQDPENQLVCDDPIREVAFGLENLGIERMQMRKRVDEVVATLRLGTLSGKKINELSCGQKQKIALASVLAMHPFVLSLDEPTSQLDPISADEFLATLKSLNDDLGLSVITAEHRIERCFHFADRVIFLEKGSIAFDGTKHDYATWARGIKGAPLPPVTRLFLSVNDGIPPLTVKEGRGKVYQMLGERRTWRESEILGHALKKRNGVGAFKVHEMEAGNKYEAFKTNKSAKTPESKGAIVVQNLTKIYDEGTEALKGVNLEIHSGESVAIIGENGSGKTTLVKHFNGLLRPTRGKVTLFGLDTSKEEVSSLARICGMLGQNPGYHLIFETTEQELVKTLEAMQVPADNWEEMIRNTLEFLGIKHLKDKNPLELSCGERERVALATILVYKPKIIVLDEPTRGIDQETKEVLSRYLKDYVDSGNTLILVTHDLEFAAECCNRVLLLSGGKILADGDKHEVLSGSLFFTTQFNRCFRGLYDKVVTEKEARDILSRIS